MGTADTKSVKKRVLFLLEAFDKGGIEKVTLDIVNNLDPEKYDITVQTFWYGGHCQSLVNNNVHVIPFFFKRYVRGIIRLIQYLPPKMLYTLFVHGKYDVEIAASDGGAAKVISGSTNRKAKKICWVHMDVVARGSKLPEFQDAETAKTIYEKFDQIVPVSQVCAERFQEKFGFEYPITVVRNPLPVEDILNKAKSGNVLPEGNELKIICVGRLVEQKGFDRLIEVCKQLADNGISNYMIYIIGEGPERNNLENCIRENKLDSIIKLIGFQKNPYSYIKSADVFLLTSRDEAFPLVVGESLIIGVPVLATDCAGISEWLEDGKYGMILENSIDGIYKGLYEILENSGIIKEYSARIIEKQNEISFEKQLKEFEIVLE
ncbi:MAG: glycosyltransferase [Clostridia bacterium]|nr:glycosyltransferase [Clostridia bacterium]